MAIGRTTTAVGTAMTATMPGVTKRMADRAVTKEIIRRMKTMPTEMTVNLSKPGMHPPYSAGAMPRKFDNVLKGLLSISVWLVLYLQKKSCNCIK